MDARTRGMDAALERRTMGTVWVAMGTTGKLVRSFEGRSRLFRDPGERQDGASRPAPGPIPSTPSSASGWAPRGTSTDPPAPPSA